jgi:hypothetical protein
VQNVKDLEMLDRLHLGNDNDDNIGPSENFDTVNSDDETYDPANPDQEEYF